MADAVVVHLFVHCSQALTLSLVDSWGGVGADGAFPAAHEGGGRAGFRGPRVISCDCLLFSVFV